MPDIDEAFASLEALDEQGRSAVTLAGALWAEMYCGAIKRAERAEYLLARLRDWTTGWGLTFDLSRAEAHFDAQPDGRPPGLLAHHFALLSERSAEVRELSARLDEVLDEREQLELRLEAAQGELKRLRTPATP